MAVRCKVFGHQWRLKQRSNVIQFDDMGYPLRLFICECSRCGKSEQLWIDSTESINDVALKWTNEDKIPIPPKADAKWANNDFGRTWSELE